MRYLADFPSRVLGSARLTLKMCVDSTFGSSQESASDNARFAFEHTESSSSLTPVFGKLPAQIQILRPIKFVR